MLKSPSGIQKQLIAAIAIIGEQNFPRMTKEDIEDKTKEELE